MPRNTQSTRQIHILRQLERCQGLTLEELAAALPDDYPKNLRTLRRDLEALEAAHIPIVTERVDGRTRWKLMEGFRHVPALCFAPTELMALTFSRGLLKPLEGTELHESLQSALHKAASALPPPGLEYVRRMQDYFSVGLGPHKTYRQHKETVARLTQAIEKHRTVQVRYFTASRNVTTRREVDPYHLHYAAGALYLIAWCHRRKDVLLFGVDRIRSLTLTDHPYQLPLGFDIQAYTRDALLIMRGRPLNVDLLFDRRTAAWAKDRTWHQTQVLTPQKQGRLKMTLQVADTPELVGWILSFGSGVHVIGPDALRQKVLEEARKILSPA